MTQKEKKILWNRILSCGHERATNLNFIAKVYDKPKIGDKCFCRECCNDVKIVRIEECSNTEVKELKSIMKEKR